MSYRKYAKFSRAAYDNADPVAKDILIKFLNKRGVFALAEEKQDADVKALQPVYYEGEIKAGWIGDWPEDFETVDIPYRKKELLKKHGAENLIFWVISGDLKHAWEIEGTELTKDRHGKKDTTRRKEDEFFMIPVERCKLISLKGII